jgi:hypothetical protein
MLNWPTGPDGQLKLCPISGGFHLRPSTLSGGPSITQFEQVIPQQDDHWIASFSFKVTSRDEQLTMSAMLTTLRGRTKTIAVPAFGRIRAPWEIDQYQRVLRPSMVRNKQFDGTVFADPAATLVNSLIVAELMQAADAQATVVKIRVLQGGKLVPGMRFGSKNRLYEIGQDQFQDFGDGTYSVEIFPWLRRGLDAGAPLDFVSPTCEMRLATDAEGGEAMRSLNVLKFATVTLTFEEVVEVVEGILDFSNPENSILYLLLLD